MTVFRFTFASVEKISHHKYEGCTSFYSFKIMLDLGSILWTNYIIQTHLIQSSCALLIRLALSEQLLLFIFGCHFPFLPLDFNQMNTVGTVAEISATKFTLKTSEWMVAGSKHLLKYIHPCYFTSKLNAR